MYYIRSLIKSIVFLLNLIIFWCHWLLHNTYIFISSVVFIITQLDNKGQACTGYLIAQLRKLKPLQNCVYFYILFRQVHVSILPDWVNHDNKDITKTSCLKLKGVRDLGLNVTDFNRNQIHHLRIWDFDNINEILNL